MEIKSKDIELDELKRWMTGRWIGVLARLGNETLVDAVRRWEAKPTATTHGPCPVHGGANGDAFRLFPQGARNGGADETGGGYCNTCRAFQDGFKLLMESNGWSFQETLLEVARASGFRPGARPEDLRTPPIQAKDASAQIEEDRRKHWSLRKIHQGSVPVHAQGNATAALVRKYLQSRGITQIPITGDLRAHPGLFYRPKDQEPAHLAGAYPAMVAVVRDPSGKAVSLHRTWLTADGRKAPLAQPRREVSRPSYFSTHGAAIRLGAPNGVLGVAEGIETALSAQQATGLAVWSTLNATLMEQLEVPDTVGMVVIFADKDRATVNGKHAGQSAAAKLAERLIVQGRDVVICVPPEAIAEGDKGVDWNDILMRHGPEGFPGYLRHLGDTAVACDARPALRVVQG